MLALRNGIVYIVPVVLIGSVFLLIQQFPIEAWTQWLQDVKLDVPLAQISGATFSIMALVAVLGISYEYIKAEGFPALPGSIIALISFIIVMPSSVFQIGENGAQIDGTEISGVISKDWTGAKGMVTAIIIGLAVGWIYSFFLKKDIRIKMPETVPEGVVNAFTALVPGIVIVTISGSIYFIFEQFLHTTFTEFIYSIIQTPLQGLSDSYGGLVVMSLLISVCWIFGIHGSNISEAVIGPLLYANMAGNAQIVASGKALTVANGGHIVTHQTQDLLNVTGSGMTIGIVVFMIFFAKSQQFKQLGKLSFIPSLFNINEPIIFGTPIILNPFLIVPFVLVPLISVSITYFCQAIGWVPLFTGVMAPWTTPPIIRGLINGGWQMAIMEAISLVLSIVIYFPFIKRYDSILYKKEQEIANAKSDTQPKLEADAK
jgi:PTS system cellobiose-specific IIC component